MIGANLSEPIKMAKLIGDRCRGERSPDFVLTALVRGHSRVTDDCPGPAKNGISVRRSAPLVSCIMPTYNRRDFIPVALECFLAQDYINRELLVVDDGEDAVGDLLEGQPGVRYLRLKERTSIGIKRNIACGVARGEVILHWDDDDWFGRQRLSRQVEPILCREADITGLMCDCVLLLPSGECWALTPELHRSMFVGNVHGATLAFRRALWLKNLRYPDVSLAEDADFLRGALARGMRLKRLRNGGLFIHVRHGRNARRFEAGRFGDPAGWLRIPEPSAEAKQAARAYRACAGGQRAGPPP
jgi:glycosyltransferase involved in cell wall biosynthesis